MSVQIVTVSSKGQIAIPANIRNALSIKTGDKLIAYASGDVIMLKALQLNPAAEFEASMDKAREWAASVGYEESDIDDVIASVRKRNRK